MRINKDQVQGRRDLDYSLYYIKLSDIIKGKRPINVPIKNDTKYKDIIDDEIVEESDNTEETKDNGLKKIDLVNKNYLVDKNMEQNLYVKTGILDSSIADSLSQEYITRNRTQQHILIYDVIPTNRDLRYLVNIMDYSFIEVPIKDLIYELDYASIQLTELIRANKRDEIHIRLDYQDIDLTTDGSYFNIPKPSQGRVSLTGADIDLQEIENESEESAENRDDEGSKDDIQAEISETILSLIEDPNKVPDSLVNPNVEKVLKSLNKIVTRHTLKKIKSINLTSSLIREMVIQRRYSNLYENINKIKQQLIYFDIELDEVELAKVGSNNLNIEKLTVINSKPDNPNYKNGVRDLISSYQTIQELNCQDLRELNNVYRYNILQTTRNLENSDIENDTNILLNPNYSVYIQDEVVEIIGDGGNMRLNIFKNNNVNIITKKPHLLYNKRLDCRVIDNIKMYFTDKYFYYDIVLDENINLVEMD